MTIQRQPDETRLPLVEPDTATGRTAELFEEAHKALGLTSNLVRAMANSPEVLKGHLAFGTALGAGSLPIDARLSIGLLVAQELGDDYGLSAHVFLATRVAGLDEHQVTRARRGEADDPVAAAALSLASALLGGGKHPYPATGRGILTEGQMVEVAAHVGVNTFTSRLALAARVPLDWPVVHHTDLDPHPETRRTTVQARMTNPFYALPDALKGIGSIFKAVGTGGITQNLQEIVGLRASQINGCSACVHAHNLNLAKAGESAERIGAVAAWREAPLFDDAERAALALTEAVTRLADRSGEAVEDRLWNEVADHFDEKQIAALLLLIGTTNLFNRINAAVREPAGATWG